MDQLKHSEHYSLISSPSPPHPTTEEEEAENAEVEKPSLNKTTK